jgi:aminotransferase
LVKTFEDKVSNFLGIKQENFHTIASCSDAIFAIFKVLELKKGSKVIIPSISFPAVPSAIIDAGLEPVIIDIDFSSGNICFEELKKIYTKDCSALFLLDYGGIPVNIEKAREIVGKDCKILLDAAPSFGTFIENNFSGSNADFVCWSFDAMKLIPCGEGGGIYFQDLNLLEKFKEYCYLGLPASSKSGIDSAKKEKSSMWWEYQLNVPGRRSIFTNVNAAIGIPEIDKVHQKLQKRRETRKKYEEAIDIIDYLSFINQNENGVEYSNYFFTILTTERDELAHYLMKNDIYTTFRYFPIHKINLFKQNSLICSNAEKFSNMALNIPIHENLKKNEIDHIIMSIQNFKEK